MVQVAAAEDQGESALPWERMAGLSDRLSSAFRAFSGDEDEEGGYKGGCLVQAWEPKIDSSGSVVLETKELPVLISGVGDALALFRCVCCECHFYPDTARHDNSSSVGRVFATGEPALACDVDMTSAMKNSSDVLEDLSRGLQCTAHLPLFSDTTRCSIVGVLEIVCLDRELVLGSTMEHMISCLQDAQLHTIPVDELAGIRSCLMSHTAQ